MSATKSVDSHGAGGGSRLSAAGSRPTTYLRRRAPPDDVELTIFRAGGSTEANLQRWVDHPLAQKRVSTMARHGCPRWAKYARKALLDMDLLKEVGEEREVSHRPAKLFRFDEKAYGRFVKRGERFDV